MEIRVRTFYRRRIIVKIIFIIITLFVLILIDQHRYFIYDKERKRCITIWKRIGFGNCYIIPGKYRSIFSPANNYIKTTSSNNYIGIIWNTGDQYGYKISVYKEFSTVNLRSDIKMYKEDSELLKEYGLINNLGYNNDLSKSDKSAFYKKYDYRYIKINGLFKSKVFFNP